jgi:SAM-dependent methyltransferase
MSKKPFQSRPFASNNPYTNNNYISDKWQERVAQVAYRFNQQYQNQTFELPAEVQAMPIYREWVAGILADTLNSRGSQLNSKLIKGVELGPAHHLNYSNEQFDLAIATGFSCYFPLEYWAAVLAEAKRVLKPDGLFVFDILNPEQPLAEDWAVLETYLGAEVFLEPLAEWEKIIKAAGAKVIGRQSGELFDLYKVRF